MQKQDSSTITTVDEYQLISFSDLLTVVLRARWTVLAVTLLTMACGLSWTLFHATYKSQGFFQFGGAIPIAMEKDKDKYRDKYKDNDNEPSSGIALSDFKRFVAFYGTGERFNDYMRDKKLDSTPGVNDLRSTFFSRDGIARIIEPVYPFTKLDAKELMEQPKENSNNVIGLRISYESSSPEIAKQMVGLLGRYVMDSIVYFIYSDTLHSKHDEIQTKITKLDSTIINNKILLEEYRRKAIDLKQIVARNPGAANQGMRQVMEVTKDSARYLPPTTLLMTTEVQASEANEAILKAKYEQQKNMLLLEYYDRVMAILDGTKSGETVLRSLEPVKESIFKHKNLQDDTVKAVYNMITIDNQTAINVYFNKSHFIAGPTLPEHSTARPTVALAVSLLLGFFLSMLFVFGRKWWRDNNLQVSR